MAPAASSRACQVARGSASVPVMTKVLPASALAPRVLDRGAGLDPQALAQERRPRARFTGSSSHSRTRARDRRADLVDRLDLVDRRREQPVEVRERARQDRRAALADVADAERVQEPRERDVLGALERGDQVLRRLLAHPLERGQLLGGEREQVGRTAHPLGRDQLLDPLLAEARRCPARCGWRSGAAPRAPARGTPGSGSAARPRPRRGPRACRTPGSASGSRHGTVSGGRSSSTTFTIFGITSPARSTKTVSPMRTSSRSISSWLCRPACTTVTPPIWTGGSTATGVSAPVRPTEVSMFSTTRRLLARRELHRDRPARRAVQRAQPLAQRELVDLHHRAVDLVAQAVAPLAQRLVVGLRRLDPAARHLAPVDPEAQLAQALEQLPVRLHPELALALADAVREQLERARGGDLRVELAQGAGGRVAGVREQLETLRRALRVHGGEGGARHQHLPAHLEQRGHGVAAQPQRQRAHGAQVVRDVFAGPAVAAGRAEREGAGLEAQGHRHPVVLGLGGVHQRLAAPQVAAHPSVERGQVLRRQGVVERQHRHRMLDRPKARRRRPADPLGGRTRVGPLRVRRLERLSLPEEPVVLGIRDRRVVEHVVAVVVRLELPRATAGARVPSSSRHAPTHRARLARRGRAPRSEAKPSVGRVAELRPAGPHFCG